MSPESLKPQFFVTRQNGNMVPLIALDELPTTVEIRDVKHTLTPYDIAGMTNVGNHDTRHLKHIVDVPATLTTSTLIDRSLMASKFATAGFEHHLSRPSTPGVLYQGPPKAYGIQEQAPSSLGPTAPEYGTAPALPPTPLRIDRNANPQVKARAQQPLPPWHDPSALPDTVKSAPGVKEFCSYWLRHGECDYAQQGCLYKHEMPLDQPTLQRLGLRDIPRWYRERHGLGSYLSANVTLGASDAEDAATRADPKREMMDKDWRRGGAGRKLSHTEMEGLRSGFARMGNQGGETMKTSSFSRLQTNKGVPGPPPTTPQIPTSNMVSARAFYANSAGYKRQSQPQVLKPVNSATRPFESLQDIENRKTILKHQEKENERAQRIALLQKRTSDIEDRPSTLSSARTKDSSSGTGNTTPTDHAETATPATSTEASDNELLLDSPVPAQINMASTGASVRTMTILQPQPKAPTPTVLKPVRRGHSHSHNHIRTQAINSSKSVPAAPSTSTSTGKNVSTAKKRMSTRKSRRRAAGESDADLDSLGSGKKSSLQGPYDHDD